MEHLKITREQERVLINHMGSLEKLIRMHRNEDENTVLDDLTTDQLIDAYFGYYTIKETFEFDDWVLTASGEIKQIAAVQRWSENTEVEYIYEGGECTTVEPKRHATDEEIAGEKERNWWDKHNRDVWELREDDILEYLGDLYIVDCFDSVKVSLKSGIERKSNYVEVFQFVKKHFKVVAFAEDRKDVDHA